MVGLGSFTSLVGGNGIGHINSQTLSSPVSTGIVNLWSNHHPSIHAVLSRPLTLAVPPFVRAVSTGDGFGHSRGWNDEFCIAVGPVFCTAGILAYCLLLNWGNNSHRLKGSSEWAVSWRT